MRLSSMDNGGIRAPLFLTILVMAVVPLCAAFYLLDRAVATSLDLGFNGSVMHALEDSSHNLKTLKRLDPQRQEQYREEFEAVERLQRVYSDPGTLKAEVLDSLRIYFGLGLVAAVLLSMLLAMLLSRRIARLYEKTFDELIRHRQKVRYLEEMASWQDLARMLAHEIKNPLTPIEVLVTSLSKAYSSQSGRSFAPVGPGADHDRRGARLSEEHGEQVRRVRAAAVRSSGGGGCFECGREDRQGGGRRSFDTAELQVSEQPAPLQARARIDVALFRQVLTNIVRNGVEANADRRVCFDIRARRQGGSLVLSIANDGQSVPGD